MEIRESKRLAPLWAMILLLVVWTVFFGVVILDDGGLSPGLPIFLVLGYMALYGLVNKRHVVVTAGRVEVGMGPLPGAGKPDIATAAEVVRWYVRLVIVPGRYGSTKFHAAGVELADGRWIDVLAPYETRDEAWIAAHQASAIFGGGKPLPVVMTGGLPKKRNGRGGLVVIAWGGAAILALLLGLWMELARSS